MDRNPQEIIAELIKAMPERLSTKMFKREVHSLLIYIYFNKVT